MTVGFDNVFDHFERMFEDDFTTISAPTFPFYNIVKKGDNKYDIEIALAGYSKDDVEVGLENGVLSIKSKETKTEKKDEGEILHKGIAKRYFSKSFTIADDVEVKYAPPHDHKSNIAKHMIQTFKAHFILILAGTDNKFPDDCWDGLIDGAKVLQQVEGRIRQVHSMWFQFHCG